LWREVNFATHARNKYKSIWWTDLSKVSLSDHGSNWFNSNGVWQVGSGAKFKFWKDDWIINGQIKERYPIIYNNSLIKDEPIVRFGRWSTEGWE